MQRCSVLVSCTFSILFSFARVYEFIEARTDNVPRTQNDLKLLFWLLLLWLAAAAAAAATQSRTVYMVFCVCTANRRMTQNRINENGKSSRRHRRRQAQRNVSWQTENWFTALLKSMKIGKQKKKTNGVDGGMWARMRWTRTATLNSVILYSATT